MTSPQQIKQDFLEREADKIILAQAKMEYFIRYTAPQFQMMWWHRVICEHLDAVVNGEIKRLIVTLARRHGKSEIITRRFPAFWHGKRPCTPLMNCTHSADVRDENGADIQRILQTGRVQRVFPSFREITKLTTAKYDLKDGSKGRFETVNKGIAGKGYMCGIVDDYFGTREAAESETMRKKLIKWYNGTFYGCIEGEPDDDGNPVEGAIVVLCSPWHEGDLIGYLRNEMNSGREQWVDLNIQAERTVQVAVPGDPRKIGDFLWPEKYPAEHYEKIRERDPETWQAQYMGILTKEGGEVAKEEWFPIESLTMLLLRRANITPEPIVHFLGDTGDSDQQLAADAFTVYWAVVIMDGRAWVLDECRLKGKFHDLIDDVCEFFSLYAGPESLIYTENKSTGKTYTAEFIRRGFNGLLYDVPSGRNAKSKDERFINAMPEMKAGRLGFSEKVKGAIRELTGWPKLAHKDRVDVAGMVVQILLREEGATKQLQPGRRIRLGKIRRLK